MRPLVEVLSSAEGQIRTKPQIKKAVLTLMLVLMFPISLLLYFGRVRILKLTAPGRIGHLCTDIGMFVKRQLLHLEGRYFGVLISRPEVGANQSLLGYWRNHIRVINSPVWSRLLHPFGRFPYLVYDARIVAFNETAPYIEVERQWGARPPLLSLDEGHRQRGRAWLTKVGMPSDGEFVCIHIREPGYAPHDDDINTYRNVSIENYLKAATALAAKGYWVIRVGYPSMRTLPMMDKFIDYAHSEVRSDWLDVFLCAECKFFLGASSGLLFVANLFGRPCAPANQAPMSSVLAFSVHDVAIPKLLWSESESRYLSFAETFASDVSNFRFSQLYDERRIRTVENTADDVRDLALEMAERADGTAIYNAEDEQLQRRFKALFRPGHYAYGGVNRIGRDFLRKYAHLIGDEPRR